MDGEKKIEENSDNNKKKDTYKNTIHNMVIGDIQSDLMKYHNDLQLIINKDDINSHEKVNEIKNILKKISETNYMLATWNELIE